MDIANIVSLETLKQVLGRAVQLHRKRNGLSREDLAERLGLSFEMIGRLERGETWPQWDNLTAIAKALGISVGRLFESTYPVEEKTQIGPLQALEIIKKALEAQSSLPPEVASRLVRLQRLVADNNVEALVAIDQIMDKFDRAALAKPSGHGKKPEGGVL